MKLYIKNPKFAYKKIVSRYVLVDIRDEDQIHRLNPIASDIWEMCDGKHTVDEMVKIMSKRYSDVPLNLKDDIVVFVNKMLKSDIIKEI